MINPLDPLAASCEIESLRKKLDAALLQVRDNELEAAQFNEGFEAANAGKPVEAQPSYEKDMDSWEVGWAWAQYLAAKHATTTEKQVEPS